MTSLMSPQQRAGFEVAAAAHPVRSCQRCGCTDGDCTGCVERTGHPCHWITDGLCSACTPAGTAVRVPPSIAAVREILRDLRQRVAVTGCSRLTAAVISQEFVAEWIADRVLAGVGADPVPADLVDLYAATKAVLRSETPPRRPPHQRSPRAARRGHRPRQVDDVAGRDRDGARGPRGSRAVIGQLPYIHVSEAAVGQWLDAHRSAKTPAGVALVLGADGAAALLGFDDPQTMRDLSKVLADVADVIDPPKQAKR